MRETKNAYFTPSSGRNFTKINPGEMKFICSTTITNQFRRYNFVYDIQFVENYDKSDWD